jgi:UDPglucose--hexose-1-phosphate uridylyltransferase
VSELRRHPFLNQWVITATHRQDRTFHPPKDYCPLCPTQPGGFPTEIPESDYDIAVFENKFPSLSPNAGAPDIEGTELMPVRPAEGVCEVVCYTSKHDGTFAELPYQQVRKLTRVWQERYIELSSRPEVEYVFIFENKGDVIGVTLAHPHGQIYAYPFIPPTAETQLAAEKAHYQKTGRTLHEDWLADEKTDGRRIVWENHSFVVVVPFFARYPYETHVVPKQPVGSLAEMSIGMLDDLAEALLFTTRTLDKVFDFSMPYIMAMRQRPCVPGCEASVFRVEFYPPYRTANKLKYLAGSEAAMDAFINDTLPEDKAAELRSIQIDPIR